MAEIEHKLYFAVGYSSCGVDLRKLKIIWEENKIIHKGNQ